MRKKLMLFVFASLFLLSALAFTGVTSHHAFAASTTAARHTTAAVALSCPPTVQYGSSGSAVKTLQSALNELYQDYDDPSYYEMSPDSFNYPLAVDGSFGPQTRNAVIDFQTWNSPAFGGNLVVDGIVGPNTWHVLHKC